jgi:hydrogenase expression/formation protein HypE
MKSDVILLGHGSGGKLSHDLLDNLIVPTLSGIGQRDQNDAAVLTKQNGRLAFTTDSYVVDPIFFPGGNIGDLAVHGTVNDLAMAGAVPLVISVGLIIEEGLLIEDLKRVLESMRDAARQAEVKIVTGDTKVVPRGKADKLFINTSGIGVIEHDLQISGTNAQVGDKIIINVDLVAELGCQLHTLRDPTRGGVATTLKEIALQSQVEITLQETALPIDKSVGGACAILGLDPLFVANEGKLLAFVSPEAVDQALAIIKSHKHGSQAAIIGEVTATANGKVRLQTAIGGLRAIEMLAGEQLPRIC